jgi:SEC-C motif
MPTPAQVMASIANAQASTGPRSEAGLATSSKNAIKTGLYAANDFIRPGEEADYDAIVDRLVRELSPVTLLEENLTDEILRAIWKLRRCGLVEGTLAAQLTTGSEPVPDPMQNEAADKLQNSVDRARAQSHRLLHRCTSELRRLQTDRLYRDEILRAGTSIARLGLGDFRAIMKGLDERTAADLRTHKLEGTDNVVSILENRHRAIAVIPPVIPATRKPVATGAEEADEFLARLTKSTETAATKRTGDAAPQNAQIARNAPCHCNSGLKYKRCCGQNAPAQLSVARSAA